MELGHLLIIQEHLNVEVPQTLLEAAGFTVDVIPASALPETHPCDAIIVRPALSLSLTLDRIDLLLRQKQVPPLYLLLDRADEDLFVQAIKSGVENVFTLDQPARMLSTLAQAFQPSQRWPLRKVDQNSTQAKDEIHLRKLNEQIRFQQKLLDTIPFPVFYKQLNGVYLSCNEAFCQSVYERSREEIVGRTMYDFRQIIPDAELDRFKEIEQRIIASGETESYETRLITANEKLRDYFISKALFKDLEGQPVGIIGVMVDISEQKKNADQLMKRLETERALSTLTSEYVAGGNPTRTINNTLFSLIRIAGASKAIRYDILGKNDLKAYAYSTNLKKTGRGFRHLINVNQAPLDEWTHDLAYHEYLVLTDQHKNALRGLDNAWTFDRGSDPILVIPYRINEKVGGWFEFHSPTQLNMKRGSEELVLFLSAVSILGSILERQQKEAEFRMLTTAVEHSADAIIIVESPGKIIYVNPSHLRMSGYSRDELVGESISRLLPDDQDALLLKEASEYFRRGESWERTLLSERKDGTTFQEHVTVSPITNRKGVLTHLVIIGRDMTKNLHLETKLRQSQKLESIGQLAAGIAHEINTPVQYLGDNIQFLQDHIGDMFSIIGSYGTFCEGMLAGEDTDSLKQRVATMLDQLDLDFLRDELPQAIDQSLEGVERISKIVSAMKDFSHPGIETKQPIRLEDAINSTLTVTRNLWKYQAETIVNLPDDLPVIHGYAAELNQVFLNLIVNAVQAIEEKRHQSNDPLGTIHISAQVQNNSIELHFKDSGTGISEKIGSRIFDPFFTTKEVGKGSGQGLAIVYNVIHEKHGGSIDYTSEPGVGTDFIIRLPLSDMDKQVDPENKGTIQ